MKVALRTLAKSSNEMSILSNQGLLRVFGIGTRRVRLPGGNAPATRKTKEMLRGLKWVVAGLLQWVLFLHDAAGTAE